MIEARRVNKPHALIQIYTELEVTEQKIFNFIIFSVLNKNINKDNEIIASNKELNDFIGTKLHSSRLKKHLENLMSVIVEVDIFKNDKDDWTLVHLVRSAKKNKGLLTFQIENNLKDNILNTERFAKLDFTYINSLKSKYSIRLYENCVRYLCNNRFIQLPELEILEFRKLLGISENQYLNFPSLRTKVIDKAINEINSTGDVTITYKTKKIGQKVTHIKFETYYNNANDLPMLNVLGITYSLDLDIFRQYIHKFADKQIVDKLNNQNVFYSKKYNEFFIIGVYGETILNPNTSAQVIGNCFKNREKLDWFKPEYFENMLRKARRIKNQERFEHHPKNS